MKHLFKLSISNSRFIIAHVLMLSLTSFSSCREDEKQPKASCNCDGGQTGVTVSHSEGTVLFQEEIGLWGISVQVEGTYDVVQVFFSCNLEESYKANNRKVTFSGNTYDFPDKISGTPASTQFFCIGLNSITNL